MTWLTRGEWVAYGEPMEIQGLEPGSLLLGATISSGCIISAWAGVVRDRKLDCHYRGSRSRICNPADDAVRA